MSVENDNDLYPPVFKNDIVLDPIVMADDEMVNQAVRTSKELIHDDGGTVLSHGIYMGLPINSGLSERKIKASIRAGYGTLQLRYIYNPDANEGAEAP